MLKIVNHSKKSDIAKKYYSVYIAYKREHEIFEKYF